jgi:hypothetical protein
MKLLLIFMLIFSTGLKSWGQRFDKKCEVLDALFKDSIVASSFDLKFKNDTLTLLDNTTWLVKNCLNLKWGTNLVLTRNDSSAKAQIRKGDTYVTFRDQCKVFILQKVTKKRRHLELTIYQPCSGLMDKVLVKQNANGIRVVSVGKFVL